MRLGQAYQQFAQDLLSVCDIPAELATLPITFEEPVYGSNEPTFTEFMAPGVILSITYFMAVGLTALSFIIERKEGLLERSWVAGVTATEVMLAHVVAQFAVMLVQVRLDQNQIVSKLLKMSHLNFSILAFSTHFWSY